MVENFTDSSHKDENQVTGIFMDENWMLSSHVLDIKKEKKLLVVMMMKTSSLALLGENQHIHLCILLLSASLVSILFFH